MNSSRTFRVFVSSTFADLVEERNALQRRVWPELAKLCEKAGFRFQAIDLRWGVPSEAALDQRTSRICLDELKRCQDTSPRPNFIILLGNRYGWRPLPEEIEAREFEAIAAKAQSLGLETSLLREWYRLDTNAVPAVYYLRPRRQDTDEANGKWWADNVEQTLRTVLLRCIEALWAKDDPRRAVYERSLTEREIMAGALNPAASDARDHVFAYFRGVDYLDSVTHVDEAEATHLRPFVDFVANTTECDTTARQLHRNLKKILEAALGHQHVRKFDATWTGTTVSQDHLDRLCDAVLNDLRGVIEAEIRKFEEKPPLEVEISAHEEFVKLRGGSDNSGQSRFQGRAETLNVIAEYLRASDKNRPLVIYGPAGSGKSALMAKAAQDADKNFPNSVRLRRFIGVTPPSVDARSLLQGLCEELGQKFHNTAEVPLEYRELVSAFRERFNWATADRPVIVFLDAVDQLSDTDNARSLRWLPQQLPPHVRLVVSVLDDPHSAEADPGNKLPTNSDPFETLKRRDKVGELFHQIGDYPEHDAEALLVHWLRADNRTLTDDQKTLVLDAFAICPRPLFLKLAAEEAKEWRSDSTAMMMPSAATPDEMLSAIINQLFDRLSEPSNHGERLVERAIGYLVASKNGLTEAELIGLLSTDKEFFGEFTGRAKTVNQPLPPGIDSLPVAVWVRLYSDLKPYLTTRRADGTTPLAFYHRSLERVARSRFLSKPDIAGQRHKHISDYFTPKSKDAKGEMKFDALGFFRLTLEEQRARAKKLPPEPRPVNIRMVMELPYQLLEVAKLLGKNDATSPHWDAAIVTFSNIHLLEAICESRNIDAHLPLYKAFLTRCPSNDQKAALRAVFSTISRNAVLLQSSPTLLFQMLWNGVQCWKPSSLLEQMRKDRAAFNSSPWLESLSPPRLPPTSCVTAYLRIHGNSVHHLAWSPSGLHLVSASKCGRIAVYHTTDKTIYHSNGTPFPVVCLKWLTSDTFMAVFDNYTVRTYSIYATLLDESKLRVSAVRAQLGDVSKCGRYVAVASVCGVLTVHEIGPFKGSPKRRFQRKLKNRESHCLRWCSRTPGILALSCDSRVTVFDVTQRRSIAAFSSRSLEMDYDDTLYKETGSPFPLYQPSLIAWSPSEPLLAVVFADCFPALIDTDNWKYIYSSTGHDHGVTSIDWSPDGDLLASVSRFELLLVSNIRTRQDALCLESLHMGAPTCVSWSPFQHVLATGGDDGVVMTLTVADSEDQEDEDTYAPPRGMQQVHAFEYSSKGKYIGTVSGYFDEPQVQDLETQKVKHLLCHGDLAHGPDAFHFSPDESMASVVKGKSAWLFRIDMEASIRGDSFGRITGCEEVGVFACKWAPNSSRLLTIECDQTTRLWIPAELSHVADVGCGEEFNTLSWSPSGHRFVNGSSWDVCLHNGESGDVMSCASLAIDITTVGWSPDGNRFLAIGWDGMWRLYDSDAGRVVEILYGFKWTKKAIWSPDSRVFVLSGTCGTVVFYEAVSGLEVWRSRSTNCERFVWTEAVARVNLIDERYFIFFGPATKTRVFDLSEYRWSSITHVLENFPDQLITSGFDFCVTDESFVVRDARGRAIGFVPVAADSVRVNPNGFEWAFVENGCLFRVQLASR